MGPRLWGASCEMGIGLGVGLLRGVREGTQAAGTVAGRLLPFGGATPGNFTGNPRSRGWLM